MREPAENHFPKRTSAFIHAGAAHFHIQKMGKLQHVPGWKIEQIAGGEKVKARRFPYSSQVYLLMLSQFLHLFSLNEIVDATTGGCRDSGCGTSTPSTRPPSCS